MKKLILSLLVLISCTSFSQTYSSQNINLVGFINPNNSAIGIGPDDRRYSGCWGWHQQSTNKEYAIVGSSSGTYFIDVTNPSTPTVSAFVQGKSSCTWREIKTYQNYCYIVSDDGAPNAFQIVDMSALPSTVSLVYNSKNLFERGHTIWIDNDKMYVGGVTYMSGSNPASSPMNVYSLANPASPVLLRQVSQDIQSTIFNYVHDMFVRNDTVYASTGGNGLYVLKFNSSNNTFTQLGSFTGYESAGYNHSSSLTKNGKYLMFCDEVPEALPIHFVDVQNLGNIQPVKTFKPAQKTTPHNPYIIGDNFAIVSCYQDGLMIYDISQPNTIGFAGYFDTYPQGGANTGNYSDSPYRGNWGAYPYLPSGIIIANDMQNGVFILDATTAYTNTVKNPLGIQTNLSTENNIIVYPNPASNRISINYQTANNTHLEIKNIVGQVVFEKDCFGIIKDYVDVSQFENGSYFISISDNNYSKNQKLIINH
jgi:choice-of-anchor B domain-containing protein